MKKIFAALLALFASAAFGTTTVPVQLLNPAGSSAGQSIVSTGPSSAPTWGGVGVNGIAAIAANTVLANATGSSASPTAFAMPSCSTSTSILQYTTSTGFTCSTSAWTAGNAASFSTLTATGQTSLGGAPGSEALRAVTTASAVNYVQVNGAVAGSGPSIFAQGSDTNVSLGLNSKGGGSVFLNTGGGSQVIVANTNSTNRALTFTGSNGGNPTIGTSAGNVGFSSAIAPSTTLGIVGTTLGDNASAGSIGEYVLTTGASGIALTNGTYSNLTSVTLTPGDWDLEGVCSLTASSATTAMICGLNTVSNTNPGGVQQTGVTYGSAVLGSSTIVTPIVRFNVSTPTTVYVGGQSNFSSGTVTGQGWIRQRRVR